MATAPASTFQDFRHRFPDAHTSTGAAKAESDTLVNVNRDPARRNKLIDDNNLLKGVRMTSDGPQMSTRNLIQRPSSLNFNVDQMASMNSTTVEAEYTQTLMQSNYTSVAIKAAAPYVTASADYKNETSYKNTETEKTIMVSTRYLFPQGQISFSLPGDGFANDVRLSKEFTDAIADALRKSSKLEQREALYDVFTDFGDIFRTEVEVGGTLSAHTMDTFKRTENEETVKDDVKASLEASVKEWKLGVTGGHGNSQTTITTSSGRKLNVTYIVEGGDYTKIEETKQWIASVDQSDYWRVIEVVNAVPVVELLPEATKATVKALMTPLFGRMVDVERVPGTEQYPVRIYRPKDAIPDGWYWLGHTADATQGLIVKPSFPPKTGRNYAVSTCHKGSGFTNQPFPDQPQYAPFSSYFGAPFVTGAALASDFGALRPGLFLEGQWQLNNGSSLNTAVYITRPASSVSPEDDCFDLQSVVRVHQSGTDNPPRPRWALRKNVVLFASE